MTVSASAPPGSPGRTRSAWQRTVARGSVAAGGGLLLFASFPPRELWWLAPVAIALFARAVHGCRPRAAFGYGYLFGVGFLLPLLWWVGTYVGLIATIPLVAAEAAAFGLAGVLAASLGRLRSGPLWAACAWVGVEALRSRVPFGGFPWGRLAFGQPEGAFLPMAAVGGAALLSFAVALCGFGLAALVNRLPSPRARSWRWPSRRMLAPVGYVIVPVLAGLAASGLVDTKPEAGSATVAVVQGNVPRAGLDFSSQRRAVLDNHAAQTEELAAKVAAGRLSQPDLVIWPENSSDIDPLLNPDARRVIDRAVAAIDAPTLVGAVLLRDDGRTSNTSLVWEPGIGPTARYDKRRILPFGEYMPFRDFFRLFSSQVDLAGDFVAGEGDGTVEIGGVPIALAICWEVAFDSAVTDAVRDGAQLLVVPTNNATFGYTDMTYQQQAMSRVRAVETGRAVLIAATSGVSAVISPDGTVRERTGLFTPDALVADVPLRTTETLATKLGALPEWLLTAVGIAGVLIVLRRRSVSRRCDLSVTS